MQILITEFPENEAPEGPVEILSLTWHERCKARSRYQTDKGTEIAISLPRGTMLTNGTVLHNSSERTIIVNAQRQDVLVITPGSPEETCRVAHNLGNWHRSLQIEADGRIIAEADGPLKDWLERSGISHEAQTLPFEPNLRTSAHD